jgi:hypothetical protein
MQPALVVTASVIDDRTLKLDEPLPLTTGKVRITVEVLPPPSRDELLDKIHQGQRDRGFVPPTREQVDAYLDAERKSWDD